METPTPGSKRIWLACLLLWFAIFVGLTLSSNNGGEIGYTGGEWSAVAGIPYWYVAYGYDHGTYPGAFAGLWQGQPNIRWTRLLIALCVAWYPVQMLLLLYWLMTRRLRYHLITLIGMALTVMVLGMANYWQTTRYGSDAWGWPLNNREEYHTAITALSDVSVAGTVIFLVGITIEAITRRVDKLRKTPPPSSAEAP